MEKNNILVRDLCKQFDEFLLDHISFQVPKGRIVGFIGENGAGKSTTINLILDELKKDNGQIQIFGREHTISSVKENIGVVFDECNFHIRCSDGSRTRCLLWADIDLGSFLWLPRFFGQCPSISVSVFANSRTLDIGKSSGCSGSWFLGEGRC